MYMHSGLLCYYIFSTYEVGISYLTDLKKRESFQIECFFNVLGEPILMLFCVAHALGIGSQVSSLVIQKSLL